jgi:hypothetical protein
MGVSELGEGVCRRGVVIFILYMGLLLNEVNLRV